MRGAHSFSHMQGKENARGLVSGVQGKRMKLDKFWTVQASRLIIPGGNDGRFPGRGRENNQDRMGNSRLIMPGNFGASVNI